MKGLCLALAQCASDDLQCFKESSETPWRENIQSWLTVFLAWMLLVLAPLWIGVMFLHTEGEMSV